MTSTTQFNFERGKIISTPTKESSLLQSFATEGIDYADYSKVGYLQILQDFTITVIFATPPESNL